MNKRLSFVAIIVVLVMSLASALAAVTALKELPEKKPDDYAYAMKVTPKEAYYEIFFFQPSSLVNGSGPLMNFDWRKFE